MPTRVTGKVDCFGCVCVPFRLTDKVLCVLLYVCSHVHVLCYYVVCYFTGILYAVVRQISMSFIDNKDSGFCRFCCLDGNKIINWFICL